MRKVLVVVANRGKAHFFLGEGNHPLAPVESLEHKNAFSQSSELEADRYGKEANQNLYGASSFEPQTTAVQKETDLFARHLVEKIKESFESGQYERLYLILAPGFLSPVKEHLPKQIEETLAGCIDKNLVHLSPKEIRDYLPPVL